MARRNWAITSALIDSIGELNSCPCTVELLESRQLLSGSDAMDRLDLGNLASEAAHHFNPGTVAVNLPVLGTGTVGASAGLTYRDPTNGQGLTFTLGVDSNRQNYFTVKLWGNDPDETIDLDDAGGDVLQSLEQTGGPVVNPDRFYYYSAAIPISMSLGKTAVQLQLAVSAPGKPIYSVFDSTNPDFVPDSSDATGTSPTVTGQATLSTLTDSQAMNILLADRQSIYGSNGYYSTVVSRQVLVLNPTPNANGTYSWTQPSGAPEEVTGLDLFTNLASWMAANPSATEAAWDNQIGDSKGGAGYTAFPDQLISALTSTYLLPALTDPGSGSVVYAAPLYHNPTLIARIVAAMDGSSYLQDSDGGFTAQGGGWTGLTPTSARQGTTWGGGPLEGVDAQTLGWSIIQLLNDSTAGPVFQTYLGESYDVNLNGDSVLRATAYEEMLYNHIQYLTWATGGTESQNSFENLDYYATDLALRKLQALYPNPAYANTAGAGVSRVEQLLGFIPDTMGGGVGFDYYSPYSTSTYTNYGLTADGLGEAHGALSSGFDGGGYGQLIPWIATQIAAMAAEDPSMNAIFPGTSSTILSLVQAKANASINSFDQFISPTYNATVNSSGVVTGDTYGFDPESWITYRDPKNPNTYAGGSNFNSQYLASEPTGGLDNAYALRSAYLETQYNITPTTGATFGGATSNATLDYLRGLPAYEATIESLINVNPATLTPLPDEPGRPGYTFADVQAGAVAIVNNGDQIFMNVNWRNYETNNNTLVNLVPSQILRYDYTTGTIERAGQVELPYNSATLQSDGNLSASSMFGVDVARLGNYLVVLNDGTSSYSAKLPMGIGLAEDLISHNVYSLSTSSSSPTAVSVAAGQAAIFWLNASSTISSLGTGIDIGAVGVTGSDSYSNGTYTLTGGGADIGEAADAFHFVPISISGNETITAQVLSQTAASSLAQAGVMLRDGTSAPAAFAAVVRTSGGGVRFVYRTAAGAPAAWVAVPDPLSAVYLKLTRSGNNISAYDSSDGITWTQIGTTQSITMTAPDAGLAVSSHNSSATSTATFGNVTAVAGVAPTVAAAASASASVVTGTTVSLSVLGADPGGESGLTYSWTLLGTPPDQVTYTANGTNAAKNTTVTLSTAGTYNFLVFVQNASGAYAISTLSVNVKQMLTSISVLPTSALVASGGTQFFYAAEADQFDMPIQSPQALTWTISSGVGSVDQSGVYTAPSSGGGSATVQATSGTLSGTSSVTIQAPIGIFSNAQAISTSPSGSASYNSSTGTYTVTGSGSDIWGTSDQFQYVYESLTGDGTITAYVASVTNTNAWTKTGVMFRDSLNANGAYAFLMTTPTTTEGNAFQYRSSDGGSSGQSIQSTGTGTGGPGWLRLVRTGNIFSAYLSTNGTTWTSYGTSESIPMGSTIYVGLVVSSHVSGSRATATFTNVSLTPAVRSFAASLDIGNPSPAGSYSESDGIITLTAGGSDIYGTSDQFQYGYNEVTGSGSLTMEVDSVTNTSTYTKAGIMLRNTLAANSANVSLFMTPGDGIGFEWRSSAGGSTSETVVTGLTAPYWIRLTDNSNSFTAYYSSGGSTWTQIGSAETVAMNSELFAGVVLTAHNNGALATATFNNSTNTLNPATIPPPTLSKAATAAANPVTGTSVVLSATGTDSIEGNSNLIYTWSVLGEPPALMTFSANRTNAAASTTVTFTAAGTYLFQVDIQDPNALQITSNISVTVNQNFSSISITPMAPMLGPSSSLQFTAVALDQFGIAMVSQPSLTWSPNSGSGSITTDGLFTAAIASGTASVKAASGTVNAITGVTITNQNPVVANSIGAIAGTLNATNNSAGLSVSAVDDGGQSNLTYTWSASGTPPLPVTFTPNGTNAAQNTVATFSAIGIYTLLVTIADPAGLTTTSMVSVTVNTILGTSGNDTIRLVRSGSSLVVYTNGSSYSVPYASLGAITVADGAGNDSVNVDFSGGATPVPGSGLSVSGNTGIDSLTVTGTTGADIATVNAGTIAFDSSSIAYTSIHSIVINGNGGSDSVTQAAQPGATLAFSGGIGGGPSAADTLAINAGSFTFPAPGSGQGILPMALASLSIGYGANVVLPSGTAHTDRWVLGLGSLSIVGSTGQLDLGGNDLIIYNGSLGTLTSLIQSGFSLGTFTGMGITSSAARNDAHGLTTLGILSNSAGQYSSFDGQPAGSTDVLVKYTYYGDANLDGKVDGSDYSRIDNGYLIHATGWYNGDFNYDNVIDGSDYTLIDNAFNSQGATLAAVVASAPHARHAAVVFSNTQIASEASSGSFSIDNVWAELDADRSRKIKRTGVWLGE